MTSFQWRYHHYVTEKRAKITSQFFPIWASPNQKLWRGAYRKHFNWGAGLLGLSLATLLPRKNLTSFFAVDRRELHIFSILSAKTVIQLSPISCPRKSTVLETNKHFDRQSVNFACCRKVRMQLYTFVKVNPSPQFIR